MLPSKPVKTILALPSIILSLIFFCLITFAQAQVPFEPPTNFSTGTRPLFLGKGHGDFNADGILDLAAANKGTDNVSVLLGNTAGGFGAATNFNVGSAPESIVTADFNRDGKLDLAVANPNSNNVSVLLGNGAGSFAAAVNFGVGVSPYSVATGDFNLDGKLDLAAANGDSNNVSILLGGGNGSFSAATNFPAGSVPGVLAVADFNADGMPDLAVGNGGADQFLRGFSSHPYCRW